MIRFLFPITLYLLNFSLIAAPGKALLSVDTIYAEEVPVEEGRTPNVSAKKQKCITPSEGSHERSKMACRNILVFMRYDAYWDMWQKMNTIINRLELKNFQRYSSEPEIFRLGAIISSSFLKDLFLSFEQDQILVKKTDSRWLLLTTFKLTKFFLDRIFPKLGLASKDNAEQEILAALNQYFIFESKENNELLINMLKLLARHFVIKSYIKMERLEKMDGFAGEIQPEFDQHVLSIINELLSKAEPGFLGIQ